MAGTVKAHKAPGSSDEAAGDKLAYEGPRSPIRVMQIVEALAAAPQGISLAVLARQLDLPKTSLLNHLRVLVGTGHVALRDSMYVLGPAAIRMGVIISSGFGPMAAIGPIAKQLAADSGETTICAMLDEQAFEVVYLEVHEGWQHIRYAPPTGIRRPLYCSGLGRALLAFQGDAYIESYLKGRTFERFNANTIATAPKLRKKLKEEHDNGFTFSYGERLPDLGALAAPIIDKQGRVRYSIGVTVPISRILPIKDKLIKLVLAAAERASWAIGT